MHLPDERNKVARARRRHQQLMYVWLESSTTGNTTQWLQRERKVSNIACAFLQTEDHLTISSKKVFGCCELDAKNVTSTCA